MSSKVIRNISAGSVQRETHQIELGDAEQVEATIRFGGGDLDIKVLDSEELDVEDNALLLQGDFVYNVDGLEPVIDYAVQDGQGKLRDPAHGRQHWPGSPDHRTAQRMGAGAVQLCSVEI